MLNSYVPGFSPYLLSGADAPMGVLPGSIGGDTMQQITSLQPTTAATAATGAQSLPTAQPTTAQPLSPRLTAFGPRDIGSLRAQIMGERDLALGGLRAGTRTFGALPSSAASSAFRTGRYKPSANPNLDFNNYNGSQGYYFVTNRGKHAKVKGNKSGFIPLHDDWQYRIWNERGPNKVLSTGTGAEGLQSVYTLAQQLSANDGKKANWTVEVFDPTVGRWVKYADDNPAKGLGGIGKVLGTALPIAVSMIPGLQFAGPILSTALAGAAGAGLQGKNVLKGGIMGGLTAAGGQLLGPALQGATGLSSGLSSAIGTGLGATAGGLATGQNLQSSLLGGLTSGAASYLAPQLVDKLGIQMPGTTTGGASGGAGGGLQPDGSIIVTPGASYTPTVNLGGLTGNLGGTSSTPNAPDATDPNQIVVTGSPTATPTIPIGTGGLGGTGGYPQSPGGEPIVVTGDPNQPLPTAPVVIPGVNDGSVGTVDTGDVPQVPDENSSLDDIIRYLQAAGLLSGVLGDLFGGGGGGSNGTIPGGLGGGYNPVFNAQLPTSSRPGSNYTPRTAADVAPRGNADWYRYGYGPEQSFFTNVPQGQPNTSSAYTGYGYAEGGQVSPFAVRGNGRSDDVPAMLSDGEYVIDAETVALLGDGSNDAGADLLDRFRVNLRKHKGRQLAKGEFSVKARRPEQYMYGGQA